MSDRINFAAVKHDALLAVDGQSDGYLLPQGTADDAVLALVEAVEAAHENSSSTTRVSHKLDEALGRFDFGAAA